VKKDNSRKWKIFFIVLSILYGIAISPLIFVMLPPTGNWRGWGVLAFYPLIVYIIAPLSVVSFISIIIYVIKQDPHGAARFISFTALIILCPVLFIILIMASVFLKWALWQTGIIP
jgi:hypothetical protein